MQRLATAVAETYAAGISPEGGFLPPNVPLDVLPEGFAGYREACQELPDRFHGEGASVREWLDRGFGVFPDRLATTIREARAQAELEALMTAVSVLAHAYRWDSIPVRPERYALERIELPEGLREPWSLLAARLGVIRVGNLFSMVLNNWRLATVPSGSPYSNRALAPRDLDILHAWLRPPERAGLRAFMLCVIETEARGAPALQTIVDLIAAAARQNAHETAFCLDKLETQAQEMARIFSTYIRKQQVGIDQFLLLIQPAFIWGLDEGDGPLEGASGTQVGVLQAIDGALGIGHTTPMGKGILRSRRYLPPAQRRFLDAVDAASPIVRDFVGACGDPQLTDLYNGCVETMQLWRRVHQKRGALYLRGEKEAAPDFLSTGLVARGGDRVQIFEQAMSERTSETAAALFPTAGLELSTFDAVFRYLTDHDTSSLMRGAQARAFQPGESILTQGARRQGIFVVRSGAVRVTRHTQGTSVVLAHLGPGEVFGEMSFLENTVASAAVVASGVTEIDVIEPEHVHRLLGSVPGFAGRFFQSLATFLSRRMRDRSDLLAELLLAEQPAPRRPALPPFVPLSEAGRRSVTAFDDAIRAAETLVDRGTRDDAWPSVAGACLGLAEAFASADAGLRRTLLRETSRHLLRSELIDRAIARPHGYSGDPETIECLLRTDSRGDGTLGELVDRWFRSLPTIRALRETPVRIRAAMEAAIARASHDGPTRITCLGYGPARWLLDMAVERPAVQISGIDLARAACEAGTQRARALDVAGRTHVTHANVVRLAARHAALPPQQVIGADVLFSDLADDASVVVLDWIHENLSPGGAAVIAGLAPSPDRAFVEALGWEPFRRTPDELNDLFTRSRFGADPVEITTAGAGCTAVCTKR